MKQKGLQVIIAATILASASLACGPSGSSSVQESTAPINTGDLTAVDLCQAIPQEDIEAVMGRKLVGAPQRFE